MNRLILLFTVALAVGCGRGAPGIPAAGDSCAVSDAEAAFCTSGPNYLRCAPVDGVWTWRENTCAVGQCVYQDGGVLVCQ